jgi:hypothetical protein
MMLLQSPTVTATDTACARAAAAERKTKRTHAPPKWPGLARARHAAGRLRDAQLPQQHLRAT